MNLALIGMGRMGREVERLATAEGHAVVCRSDSRTSRNGAGPNPAELAEADVAIDFSVGDAVLPNVRAAATAGLPIVVGTTGWDDDFDAVRAIVEERGTALVHGANFSIGANLFFRVVAEAARLFAPFDAYDPYLSEHHHRGKADAPSGTALRLAESLLASIARKTRVQPGNPRGAIATDALHIASVRAGAAFGQHRVGFDSEDDAIELVHTARGRRGFARGALLAAEWIVGKRGVFEFGEVLSDPRPDRGG